MCADCSEEDGRCIACTLQDQDTYQRLVLAMLDDS